ncbi:MAG: hypothetical protein U0R50_02065 [Gaiellales bacterium]
MTGCTSHWDEVEASRREAGHIAAAWQALTDERSRWLGVQKLTIDAGKWATPLHLEGSEEEIFYVLAGSGFSVQSYHDEATHTFAVGPGDCLVHRALEHAHTIGAGPDGLEVLAFGERHYAANTLLPRAGVSWLGPTWVLAGAEEDHPWTREVAVGSPDVSVLAERPTWIVNADSVEAASRRGATVARTIRNLGAAAGSLKVGLTLYDVEPGMLMNPPHAHSEEEEIFVVLAGSGELELWPHPRGANEPERFASGSSTEPVRAGTTVARPAGTGRAHSFRAGADGLRLLAFGMRQPNDICFYPRSGKVSLRGVGVIGRVEQLDYWDGED